jgi:acetyl-CoA C-acetyltransferase
MDHVTMDTKLNVNGGAIAVGHPIGATGARVLMTLIYELSRSNKKSGVAAICSGMAQGDAVWIDID